MSVPRLILVGFVAALAAGLFGYFVLFDPDEAPSSAVPTTSIDAPASSSTSPPATQPPSPTVAPRPTVAETPTSSSTTTSSIPERGKGKDKDNKGNDRG